MDGVSRATLVAYLFGLMGASVSVSASRFGSSAPAKLFGVTLGLFAVGAATLLFVRPERIHRGAEPAPAGLVALAGLATATAAGFVLLRLSVF